MKKIDTVIFDLDGTLLYTLEDLKNSVNYCMKKYDAPERSLMEVRAGVGNGIAKLLERMLPDGSKAEYFDECVDVFKKHYAQHSLDNTKPYDGIYELLKKLKENGYKMAIVSNKFHGAVVELNKQFFSEYIPVAIGESDKIRKKPAPDTVFQAVKELGSDIASCVYVGDSEVDIQTAANSGMPCISVSWGFKDRDFLEENGASIICDSAADLYEAICNF